MRKSVSFEQCEAELNRGLKRKTVNKLQFYTLLLALVGILQGFGLQKFFHKTVRFVYRDEVARIAVDQTGWLKERPTGIFDCGTRRCSLEPHLPSSTLDERFAAWVSAVPTDATPPKLKSERQRTFLILMEACTRYPKFCSDGFVSSSGITDMFTTQPVSFARVHDLSLVTWNIDLTLQEPTPLQFKRRAIAVFISNCRVSNTNRLERIDFLRSSGIEVHSYGRCTRTHHLEVEFPECLRLARSNPLDDEQKLCVFKYYRFALTIENHDDPGYITEKVYHAFAAGTVPIYYGHDGNRQYFPSNNSVIRLPKEIEAHQVAHQIKLLMNDDEQYLEMLSWKNSPRNHLPSQFLQQHVHSLGNLPCVMCNIIQKA